VGYTSSQRVPRLWRMPPSLHAVDDLQHPLMNNSLLGVVVGGLCNGPPTTTPNKLLFIRGCCKSSTACKEGGILHKRGTLWEEVYPTLEKFGPIKTNPSIFLILIYVVLRLYVCMYVHILSLNSHWNPGV
jgi:hypothetical protein